MRIARALRRQAPNRPKPLPKATIEYEDENSRVPDTIRVPFDDGTTAIYDLRQDLPAPLVYRNIQIIQGWQGYTPPGLREEKAE